MLFNDGGSGASFISASKLLDAVSVLPGNAGEQSDAPQAYTQSKIDAGTNEYNTETWVELPKHMWRPEWHGMRRPVCPLHLSLYGHPLSGVFWERHCHQKLKEAGFVNIPSWECLLVHPEYKTILSVYADDFEIARKAENSKRAWKVITDAGIDLDEPTKFDHYLGCGQKPIDVKDILEYIYDEDDPKSAPKVGGRPSSKHQRVPIRQEWLQQTDS